VERTAASFLKLEDANLAVGMMSTIAPQPFTGFMRRFQARNPGIEVTLQQASLAELCDLLTVGKLDVALIACTERVEPPLTSARLYGERFVVGCAAAHRLAMKSEVALGDLDGEYYFTRHDCPFSEQLFETCRANGIELRKCLRSERDDWILAMVAEGLGICFLPEYTALAPGIVGRPLAACGIERDVCLVTVGGRRASPPVKAFVAAVRHHRWSAGPAS
jgi:DNA-binding transcriptional LysR family regulator